MIGATSLTGLLLRAHFGLFYKMESTTVPKRIQRKRARGWKKPDNTVDITRPGRWGNPFIVGQDGSLSECIRLLELLLSGCICVSCKASIESQKKYLKNIESDIKTLRGKNLMCWCREGKPCHGDILLKVANA